MSAGVQPPTAAMPEPVSPVPDAQPVPPGEFVSGPGSVQVGEFVGERPVSGLESARAAEHGDGPDEGAGGSEPQPSLSSRRSDRPLPDDDTAEELEAGSVVAGSGFGDGEAGPVVAGSGFGDGDAGSVVAGSGFGDGMSAESLELAAVVAERDAYLDDLKRVTAEFTNFRRQTLRRTTELTEHAAAGLAKALLPVLDACEAAVGQGVEGMEAVQSQLLAVLSAEGLSVIGSVDEPFDPAFHEAVMSEQSGEAVPVVAEVLRTGYAWKGRMLRPAMVRVRG